MLKLLHTMTKWDLSQNFEGGSIQRKLVSVHTIPIDFFFKVISVYAEKDLDKISHAFMINKPKKKKLRIEGNVPTLIKGKYENSTQVLLYLIMKDSNLSLEVSSSHFHLT